MAGIKDFEQFGGGGGLEFIESQTASNSPEITFTGLNSHFRYFLTYSSVRPSSDGAVLFLRMSNDGGATFVSSGYESGFLNNSYNSTTINITTSTGAWSISGDSDAASANNTINGSFYISPRNSSQPWVNGSASYASTSGVTKFGTFGGRGGGANFDSLQFAFTSGNILDGQFVIYGMVDS